MQATSLPSRRNFIKSLGAAALGSTLARSPHLAQAANAPPVRVITHGPKHHWFGYYDKLQFDPTDQLVLGMEVDFEHRSPRADDAIRVGMVDTADKGRWIELGQSTAWGWQQGCMLQWVPGSKATIEYVCTGRE